MSYDHTFAVPLWERARAGGVGACCPICGLVMLAPSRGPAGASADHILPRQRGGTFTLYGNVRNWRIMCSHCNSHLATCGHCVGALACAAAVDPRGNPKQAIRQWRMGIVAAAIPAPYPRGEHEVATGVAGLEESLDPSAVTAYPGAAERVRIARALDSIGLDEFVYPATTPAAQVWNLATLGRRYEGPVRP